MYSLGALGYCISANLWSIENSDVWQQLAHNTMGELMLFAAV